MKVTITITGEEADAAEEWTDERNKQVIIKGCAPFTDSIS